MGTTRPTTDSKVVVLDSLDGVWEQFRSRLAGLDDAEYLWTPVDGCWTVRADRSGKVTVDGAGEREIDPAPVTTIAWRLWHIAVDCLDEHAERLFGRTGAEASGASWYLEVAPALADLDRSWQCFRDGVGGRSSEEWWRPLGEAWGAYDQSSLYDLVLHAQHEITHHGAEIALLRDLYRAGGTA